MRYGLKGELMAEYRGTILVKYIGEIFSEFAESRVREAKLFKSDPDGKGLAITGIDGYEYVYPSDLFEIIDSGDAEP